MLFQSFLYKLEIFKYWFLNTYKFKSIIFLSFLNFFLKLNNFKTF